MWKTFSIEQTLALGIYNQIWKAFSGTMLTDYPSTQLENIISYFALDLHLGNVTYMYEVINEPTEIY